MTAPVYATAADLAGSAYLPAGVTVPADPEATRLLTRASRHVDRLLLAAVYDTDGVTGQPTDPDIAAALVDATCAQAAWWLSGGDETGQADLYSSVSIGPVSLSRAQGAAGATQVTAPAAVEVLTTAGLVNTGPFTGFGRLEATSR